MRKIYFLLLFACTLLTQLTLTAQTDVTVPAANTNSGGARFPLGSYWGFERSAMIYDKNEFGGVAGQIKSVSFYVNSVAAGAGEMKNVRIYMKKRAGLFTGATTYSTETTAATLVYGPTTIPATGLVANQWFTIPLATPFDYDGSDHLEVIVEVNAEGQGSGEGATSKQLRYTVQSGSGYAQNWTADNTAPAGTGTLTVNRPNIRFSIQQAPCSPGGLAGGTIVSSGSASCYGNAFSLGVTGSSVGDGITYQWQSSTDGGATWTNIAGATSASYSSVLTSSASYKRLINCAGTEAASSTFSVTAPPVLPIPILEQFAGYSSTFPPDCWTASSTFIEGNAVSAYGIGNGAVKFGFYNTSSNISLTTPSFAPLPTNHQLTFDYAYATFLFGEVDELLLQYSTDNGATFQPLMILEGGPDGILNTGGAEIDEFFPTADQWKNYTIALPAGTNKIQFTGISGFGNNLYLDNIEIAAIPSCLPPASVKAVPVNPTTERLSWVASASNPASGYEWEVRTSGAAGSGATGLVQSGSVAAGVLTATVTGLTSGTTYQYYIRANCGGGDESKWTIAKSFTTACSPTNIPFLQNFESAVAPNLPACVILEDMNGATSWVNFSGDQTTASSGTNSIRYNYSVTTAADDWFFLQGMNLVAGKTYKLTFKYKGSDGPTWVENLKVHLGAEPNAAAMTGTPLFDATGISSSLADPFEVGTGDITVAADGVYYLGFHAYSAKDNAFIYIDDISVELCPTPQSVTARSTTHTSINVNFVSGGNNFIVEYGPAGFIPGTGATAGAGTIVTGTASPIALTGLTADTPYDIYVRQSCDGGEFSGNAKVVARTLCVPASVPYTQQFNLSSVPACTSVENVNGGPTWSIYTPPAGWGFATNALAYLYSETLAADDWYFIQGLNLEAGKEYEISYLYGNTDPLYPDAMKVAIGSEASGAAATTILADHPNIVANSAAPFAKLNRVKFVPTADGVYYVGFHAYSPADRFRLILDSITVRAIPQVDVGIQTVNNLPSCAATGVVLQAVLHNYNLNSLDLAAYPVNVTALLINAANDTIKVTTTVNSGTLAAGANVNVTLPAVNLPNSLYIVNATATHADDTEVANNTYRISHVVNALPAAATFTPAAPAVCEGGTVLVSTQFTAAAPAPVTLPAVTTGVISKNIPDNSPAGIQDTLRVTNVPSTGVVTGISVSFSATHTWNSDMSVTLKAPNGRIITLASGKGGSGDNYSNAVFNSSASSTIPAGTINNITGTFRPDGTLNVGATGFQGNTANFSDLFSVGNGNWILSVRDGAAGDVGRITNWSIAITYGQPHPMVTWTPVTGLFTDAAATIPYVAGANAASVYAKPAATTTYTATTTSSFGCAVTRQVTVAVNAYTPITINPLPARICTTDPVVQLSASPIGGSWTGAGVSGNTFIPPAVATVGTFPLTYRYTNNFGCTTTATVQAKLEDCPERLRLLRDDAVVLFPNPNNGQFNIRINSTLYNKLTMHVYTTSGMTVRKVEFDGLAYGRVIPVDLTSLPAGAYMVQFSYIGGPRTADKVFNVIIGR